MDIAQGQGYSGMYSQYIFHVPDGDVDLLVCLKIKGDLLYCEYKSYHIIVILDFLERGETFYLGLEVFVSLSYDEVEQLLDVGVQFIFLIYMDIEFLFKILIWFLLEFLSSYLAVISIT